MPGNSRGPETLQDLVAERGPLARAATAAEAATAAGRVVVSVPVLAFGAMWTAALAGRVTMDTCNCWLLARGHGFQLAE